METDRGKSRLVGLVHREHTVTIDVSKGHSGYVERPRFSQATTYDVSGNKTQEEHFNPNGSLSTQTVFAYEGDKLIEVTRYTGAGSLFERIVYSYDAEGRLIEESYYDADGNGIRQRSFSYSGSGKRIEDFFFDAGPGDTYEIEGVSYNAAGVNLIESLYNSDDKLTETLFYDDNRSLIFKVIMMYDPDGKLIEEAQYAEDAFLNLAVPTLPGSVPRGAGLFRKLSVYDGQRRKVEESQYFAGSLQSKRIFSYNSSGVETEEWEYGADGTLRNRIRFSYELNSVGDWVKEVMLRWESDSDGFEPYLILQRTLTYY